MDAILSSVFSVAVLCHVVVLDAGNEVLVHDFFSSLLTI